jgi:predicted nucleotidyltransferase component of viral defense system
VEEGLLITADDVKRLAREAGLAAGVLEKDYAITWLLYGIYHTDSKLRNLLILKGGTAIRKVYFPKTWRLSEDLDFTITNRERLETVRAGFEKAFDFLASSSGIIFSLKDFASGEWSILATIQYVGPLGAKNRIAHDITLKERLVEKPEWRTISPEYPDLEKFKVKIYSLTEVLVEKLRSIIQRGKTRDYYDVWRLLMERAFDKREIQELLIKKCEMTSVKYQPKLVFDPERLDEAERYWKPALGYLTKDLPEFEKVISELKGILNFL